MTAGSMTGGLQSAVHLSPMGQADDEYDEFALQNGIDDHVVLAGVNAGARDNPRAGGKVDGGGLLTAG